MSRDTAEGRDNHVPVVVLKRLKEAHWGVYVNETHILFTPPAGAQFGYAYYTWVEAVMLETAFGL